MTHSDSHANPVGLHHHTPEERVFDDNLREFAFRVGHVCGLETGGKITPDEAYRRVKRLWKQLKVSKKSLLDRH